MKASNWRCSQIYGGGQVEDRKEGREGGREGGREEGRKGGKEGGRGEGEAKPGRQAINTQGPCRYTNNPRVTGVLDASFFKPL